IGGFGAAHGAGVGDELIGADLGACDCGFGFFRVELLCVRGGCRGHHREQCEDRHQSESQRLEVPHFLDSFPFNCRHRAHLTSVSVSRCRDLALATRGGMPKSRKTEPRWLSGFGPKLQSLIKPQEKPEICVCWEAARRLPNETRIAT